MPRSARRPRARRPTPGRIRATGTPVEHDRAGVARDVAEDERDHAHPALDVSPHPRHSAQPARLVVEVDRRRPGVVGAGDRADDPLAEIGRLKAFVAQVMLDALDHRPLEEQLPSLGRPRPAVCSISSREGALPIQRSALAGRPKRVAQPPFHVAECPPARQIVRARAVRSPPRTERRRPRAGRSLPSSNGTNIPAVAGNHWKP